MPRTNKLVDINKNLSDAQRSRIMKTPFRYLVEMKTYIGMNGSLLKDLLHRWDASSLWFRVGVRTVAFKHLDLCLALGLPILGESLPELIDNDSDSHVRLLFDGNEVIDINSVHSKLKVLQEGDNIDDFCRVYILYALCVLYFPNNQMQIRLNRCLNSREVELRGIEHLRQYWTDGDLSDE